MKSHKIEFKFIEHRFDYLLPLVGVDAEYLKARKLEAHECMRLLAEKIGQVDIASSGGMREFDICNKLVKYYRGAITEIRLKEESLGKSKALKPMSDAERVMWAEASSRRD